MLSTHFISEQQEELNHKIAEVEVIKDQLALMDVRIDRYDTIIQNIDKQIIPLIDEINVAISSVKTAYDNRIAAKCKNNLYWELTSDQSYGGRYAAEEKVYTCKKNPNVGINSGYYGAKYYRKPQNQDYGSNIVREFYGSIGSGSTILAVFGEQGTQDLLVGDTIVDNIDNPTIFSIDLPIIVGFGTTSIVGTTTDFGGSVSYGSTIIANVGIGTTIGINIGDSITLTDILNPNTTVVGFGTTTITVDNIWDPASGTFISTSAVAKSLIVNIPAVGTEIGTFKVGPLISYPALILSSSAQTDGINQNFTNIRTTQTSSTVFDYSNNPVDPVTVGIMNSMSAGLGHKLVRVNNGSPIGPFQWHEIMTADFASKTDSQLNDTEKYLKTTYPEPACGADYAEYYFGDTSWPIKYAYTYGFGGYPPLSTDSFYAQEGDTVVVGFGDTIPFNIGTTSTKPPGAASNSDCINIYNAAITAAETSRDAILARNLPKIDSLINSTVPLREIRDKMESRAFGLLQGRVYGDVEINKLKDNLKILQAADYTPFEPPVYYFDATTGKLVSSSVGVGTT